MLMWNGWYCGHDYGRFAFARYLAITRGGWSRLTSTRKSAGFCSADINRVPDPGN